MASPPCPSRNLLGWGGLTTKLLPWVGVGTKSSLLTAVLPGQMPLKNLLELRLRHSAVGRLRLSPQLCLALSA